MAETICKIPSGAHVADVLGQDFKALTYKLKDSGMSLDKAASSVYTHLRTDPAYTQNETYINAIPLGYLEWLKRTHKQTAGRVLNPDKYEDMTAVVIEDKFRPTNYVELLDENVDTDEINIDRIENTGSSDYRTAGLDFLNSIFFRG